MSTWPLGPSGSCRGFRLLSGYDFYPLVFSETPNLFKFHTAAQSGEVYLPTLKILRAWAAISLVLSGLRVWVLSAPDLTTAVG